VRVTAERRGPEIVVTVADDGAGLDLDALRSAAGEPGLSDREAAALVFRPGLSTAGAVTDISGRGVGLDAVREAVEHLRGRVAVSSEAGAGCRFEVTVPLTLAVVACVMLEAGGARYHLPTHATVSVQGDPTEAQVALEGGAALWVGGDVVPLTDLGAALGTGGPEPVGPAVVLQGSGGARHAFRVDAVLGQRDVTVKELGAVVPRSQLVAGASIEADGEVVLVLDPTALVEAAGGRRREAPAAAEPLPRRTRPRGRRPRPHRPRGCSSSTTR
jgi:chemotaxis protein histidine kinase CheA